VAVIRVRGEGLVEITRLVGRTPADSKSFRGLESKGSPAPCRVAILASPCVVPLSEGLVAELATNFTSG